MKTNSNGKISENDAQDKDVQWKERDCGAFYYFLKVHVSYVLAVLFLYV